jgi:hypothetical protein
MKQSTNRLSGDWRRADDAGRCTVGVEPQVEEVSLKIISTVRLHVIKHHATLDVPRELARFVGRLLQAERRLRGTRKGTRTLTCFWQAVWGLRWFRDRTDPTALGRDHAVSRATAHRYLDEVITVLAEQSPDLHEALQRATHEGLAYVILDGKTFSTDRCGEKTTSVKGTQTTCGIPEKPTNRAATSKHSRHPTVSRSGSPPSNPAQSTT